MDSWYNASYLHSHRSGEKYPVGPFLSRSQCLFGITGLKQVETGGGLGGRLGLSVSLTNQYGELEWLENGMLENSANSWALSLVLQNSSYGRWVVSPALWGAVDPKQGRGGSLCTLCWTPVRVLLVSLTVLFISLTCPES